MANLYRFMIIKKPNGYGTALDACRICGAEGYRQDGQNVRLPPLWVSDICAVDWRSWRVHPVGVPPRLRAADLVMDVSALAQAEKGCRSSSDTLVCGWTSCGKYFGDPRTAMIAVPLSLQHRQSLFIRLLPIPSAADHGISS